MSNIFVNLPVPASNGAGAAIDTSTMGATKTIVVGGPFQGSVTIEYANDDAAAVWAPVPNGTFVSNPGRVTIDLAVKWMRAVMESYKGGAANADVGASEVIGGGFFVPLGPAALDISQMPPFKTVVASGACIVEISEDGISWSQAFAFQNQGGKSATIVARFVRVTGGGLAWLGATDLEDDDNEIQPPFVVSETIIYARTTGSDSTGNGTSVAAAYRTFQRAVRDVPSILPPGAQYIIDISGATGVTGIDPFTEVLPANYELPCWKSPHTLLFAPTSDLYFQFRGAVDIRAIPQLTAVVPAADALINPADILSSVQDPVTQLVTITLNVSRPTWAADALKGKFVVGTAAASANAVITESSDDGLNARIAISAVAAPTAPIQIMEPSASLTGSVTTGFHGILNAQNIDSISFSGLQIIPPANAVGLWATGTGETVVQMCEMTNLALLNVNSVDLSGTSRCARTWMKTLGGAAPCQFANNVAFLQSFCDDLGLMFFKGPGNLAIFRTVFDGCPPIEALAEITGALASSLVAMPFVQIRNSLIRNGTGTAALKFHGDKAVLNRVDIYGCAGAAVNADLDQGLLELQNVRTTGPANGGTAAVIVNDGMYVKVDAATSAAPVVTTGTGDAFAVAAGIVTLTDAAALFTAAMVGSPIVITGSTTPANDGTFVITRFISATQITYANAGGVAEAYPGTWVVYSKNKPVTATRVSGAGDSFAFAVGIVTLTDAAALFTAAMVGSRITIAGATSPGNNGTFVIATFIDASNITYANAVGVTEAFVGTWVIDSDMQVGSGAIRSWPNFLSGADGRPALNEFDITAAAATGATGTGSRLYQ